MKLKLYLVKTEACNDGNLSPFIPSAETPWNRQKVIHAYRRLGFGASENEINSTLEFTPSGFIDNLIDAALALPETTTPAWAYWSYNDYEDFSDNSSNIISWKLQALEDIYNNNLRDRLTLFWHNHFVTEDDVYLCSSYLFQYYNLLQTHALGNFRDFVYHMGITPAMLIYLNGFENTRFSPNENYSRELYELITLGENNGYTQQDVVETARALTGYNDQEDGNPCSPITFNAATFDDAEKTIFGITGNFDYEGVIDNLFEQRGSLIASFICGKLYRYFVSPVINESVVDQMAGIFLDNNFEIEPVLRALFKSEHFFDESIIGVKIKSPLDLFLSCIKETGFFPGGLSNTLLGSVRAEASVNGQDIFNPPDVAGWQGDKEWLNSNTYAGRVSMIENYLSWIYFSLNNTGEPEFFRNFALAVAGGAEVHGNDPYIITRSITDRLLPKGFYDAADYDTATGVFRDEVPENYFTDGIWSLDAFSSVPWQVYQLLTHIARLPEFQLT